MNKPKRKSINNALLSSFLNNLIIYRDLQTKFNLNTFNSKQLKML